jgi:hypothetical protein
MSALSDERTGRLQLLLALTSPVILGSESSGTRDRVSLSHLRLPQPGGPGPHIYPPGTGSSSYSAGHFIPFLSPPMTCKATVESESKLCYDRRSFGLSFWCQAPIWDPRPIFLLFSLRDLWVC